MILAVSSAIFIFLATVTGIILAFEPISNQIKPYAITSASNLSLAETIETLQNEYNEVVTLKKDENDFVIASVITKEGRSNRFYINPFTGKKIGDIIKKASIFEFATNLHRSLFLKSTGRFLVGLFSFFLFLIAITGIKLIIKRQGGFKRFFSKVVKEEFAQYYHVIIGRYALIPLVIITISGIYLSLEKFDVLPSNKITHTKTQISENSKKIAVKDFKIFNATLLNEFKHLEFPFSDDEEDYFVLKLENKELYINQYSGDIISKGDFPLPLLASNLSLKLHTGQGNFLWAILLLLTCFAILFFMYSGFAMTLKRKKRSSSKMQNISDKDTAEYIILVGSETGHTQRFAKQFFEAMCLKTTSVFIDQLNNYTSYKRAKHLIVFTATYGEGEAPSNAKNFETLLDVIKQNQTIQYSVVGFGSLMYPNFCKYAIIVDALLQKNKSFMPNLPLFKINNQSLEAFKTWLGQWNDSTSLNLKIQLNKPTINRKKLSNFEVISHTEINVDDTFILQLRPQFIQKFQSGDLLAFYPEDDNVERLYSIGRVEDNILLSIKRHEFGVCSRQLSQLTQKTMIKAKIRRNLDFHFPTYAKEVVMIANGTGIAPFLGMINDKSNDVKAHLFWGGRTHDSLEIYSKFIDKAFNKKTLSSFHVAYSQEEGKKVYVQDVIQENADMIARILNTDGVVMICGSIAMQNRVLEVLNDITTEKLKQPLSTFENNEQIKMDCY
ncbi:hypothetical protein GCM10011444_15480 [Winogradskyella haliclonae]|uniref:Methionine synthase reductase n=2 Tax=Winogradskyella haliclonae TaxID=2048558 RepID=A0ABQ2BYD4_9FLAO|nr:hypothetical protein GCM10011444_15480 [Winogradskyella haliclonae]